MDSMHAGMVSDSFIKPDAGIASFLKKRFYESSINENGMHLTLKL